MSDNSNYFEAGKRFAEELTMMNPSEWQVFWDGVLSVLERSTLKEESISEVFRTLRMQPPGASSLSCLLP